MQHMPDKDFDNLFRDKFMGAEVEPSANLWGNIAGQLAPKRKRTFPLMWVAAASVAVVALVMLFTQNGEKVYLQGTAPTVAAVNATEKTQNVSVITADETNTLTPEVAVTVVTKPTHTLKNSFTPKVVPVENVDTQKNRLVAVQPSAQNEHLPIKKGDVKPLDIAPVTETPVETQTVYAQANTTNTSFDSINETEAGVSNKKGIRNMGDLINYVVEKVDKREKKLIKFDTDDDDNSSIIGLNIGFVKLNKRK